MESPATSWQDEPLVEENAPVYRLKSLQEVFDLNLSEISIPNRKGNDLTLSDQSLPAGDETGIHQFETYFAPLPEIYLPEAIAFMDAYQSESYVSCFDLISLNTLRQEPSGLLPLYLASAALATFDIPRALEFLDLAEESGKFPLGIWWFRAMAHMILNDEGKTRECLTLVLNVPPPENHRILRAWGNERKQVAQKLLSA